VTIAQRLIKGVCGGFAASVGGSWFGVGLVAW
jgi:phage shock protein PspC (stress-responsive transcriptional regulator)